MPSASRWMIGCGILLFICALIGWTRSAGMRSGVPMGLALTAAGAAAAQGRSSLRRTGNFFGTFLPVIAALMYGWQAIEDYKTLGSASARPMTTVLLTVMALAGLVTFAVLLKLRAGDNIAERGYSVTPQTGTTARAPQPQEPADQKK